MMEHHATTMTDTCSVCLASVDELGAIMCWIQSKSTMNVASVAEIRTTVTCIDSTKTKMQIKSEVSYHCVA